MKNNTKLRIIHFGVWSVPADYFVKWLRDQLNHESNVGKSIRDSFCYNELKFKFRFTKMKPGVKGSFNLEGMDICEAAELCVNYLRRLNLWATANDLETRINDSKASGIWM